MLSLAVLFAAITICKGVNSLSSSIDIDSILQLEKIRDKDKYLDRDDKYDFESPGENNNHYGSLKSQEIIELFQKAKQNKVVNDWENEQSDYREADVLLKKINGRYHKKPKKETFGDYYRNKDLDENEIDEDESYNHNHSDDHSRQSYFNEEALEQLLSSDVLDKKYYNKPKLVPNNLVGSYNFKKYGNQEKSNSDEYSKIFIILNPEAVEKSSNQGKLNNLLKKVLSMTSTQKTYEKRNNDRRYKGFPVKSGLLSRRVRRESRELYGGKDSMEDDYKPKRIRNDRGGSGGAGGRTAIPYIKNRGDIYERDH